MADWDAAFEAKPDADRDAGDGDDDIREFKTEVRLRLAREHIMQDADELVDGLHIVNASSKKFIIRKSDKSDLAVFDETNKCLRAASADFQFQKSDGSPITRKTRGVVYAISGALSTLQDTQPLVEIPLAADDGRGAAETAHFVLLKGRLRTPSAGGPVTFEVVRWTSAQVPTETPTVLATLSISAAAYVAEVAVDQTINRGDYLTVRVTAVGPTTPGSDLAAELWLEY